MSSLIALTLADIMSPVVRQVAPDCTLGEASRHMADSRISSLIVVEHGVPVGILTERDLLRLLHARTPLDILVATVMSAPVLTAPAHTQFAAAYQLVLDHQFRHLVVVDDDTGAVVGIATETDFRRPLSLQLLQQLTDLTAVMDGEPPFLAPDTPIDAVLELMRRQRVSYALAVEDQRALGILTERDIPRLLASGGPDRLHRTQLREVMCSPVHSVPYDTPVADVALQMHEQSLRHLVVVDDAGLVMGVVTLHNLMERISANLFQEVSRHQIQRLIDDNAARLQRDIARLRATRQALHESERFARSTLDALSARVVVLDEQGAVIAVNRAWRNWDATRPPPFATEEGGNYLEACTQPEGAEARPAVELAAGLRAIIAGRREDCVLEYPVRTAGAEVWLNIRATRFQGAGSLRLVVAHEDISERKHLEQHLETLVRARTAELEEAKNAAEAASRAKSAFLANMSHEIRTPMNAILGLTHLLRNRSQDPTQQRQLDKVANAGRHLLELINSILDIAKIESGKLTLEHRDFALDELLDGVVNLVNERAREKALELRLERDPAIPVSLNGDAMRLKQVLLNLATNAVKFTEHGRITIGVRRLDRPVGAPWLHFQVEDTGIGLTDEQRERLFQPFEQADNSTTRRYGGTGLGLAISRHLIALMGGRIGVESRLGAGSRFWFELPLTLATTVHPGPIPGSEAAPSSQTADGRLPPAQQGRRLLLVEDNAINQEVALALLHDLGLNVEVADNGQVAVEMARRTAYDLILMDIQMPVMNGLEAAQAIHALPGRRELPILAMTANAFEADRQDCLRAGLCDHIAKPVDPDALYAKLRRWLPRPSVSTATPASERSDAELADRIARLRALPGLDVDSGMERVLNRAATYVRLLQHFVVKAGQATERARACLVAGDRVELQRVAHELKGMAATLGVEAVREGAQSLEEALRAESPMALVQARLEQLEGIQPGLVRDIECILE